MKHQCLSAKDSVLFVAFATVHSDIQKLSQFMWGLMNWHRAKRAEILKKLQVRPGWQWTDILLSSCEKHLPMDQRLGRELHTSVGVALRFAAQFCIRSYLCYITFWLGVGPSYSCYRSLLCLILFLDYFFFNRSKLLPLTGSHLLYKRAEHWQVIIHFQISAFVCVILFYSSTKPDITITFNVHIFIIFLMYHPQNLIHLCRI